MKHYRATMVWTQNDTGPKSVTFTTKKKLLALKSQQIGHHKPLYQMSTW